MALVAPAGPVDAERVEASCERCRALGLEPVVFPAARGRYGFLAGRDEERLEDLQSAFDEPAIDAVWALRGGYGTLRILDAFDLERQRRDPIPFIGFSDNTTLHVRHAALGVVSFHGPHPGGPFPTETEASFRSVLFESRPAGPLPQRRGDPTPIPIVPGRVEAPLWGGNLALLAAMCGSREPLEAAGRILVLEDVGEPAYRVDRLLLQLERAGVFAGVSGIAMGRFSDTPEDLPNDIPKDAPENDASEDEGVRTVSEVLAAWALRIGVPCVADLPFGHVDHNCTLPVGAGAVLDADRGELTLSEPAVRSSPSA